MEKELKRPSSKGSGHERRESFKEYLAVADRRGMFVTLSDTNIDTNTLLLPLPTTTTTTTTTTGKCHRELLHPGRLKQAFSQHDAKVGAGCSSKSDST